MYSRVESSRLSIAYQMQPWDEQWALSIRLPNATVSWAVSTEHTLSNCKRTLSSSLHFILAYVDRGLRFIHECSTKVKYRIMNIRPKRKITINVPLFKKLRDIIFFCGTITLWAISRDILRGPRLFWPLKLRRFYDVLFVPLFCRPREKCMRDNVKNDLTAKRR